jgi:hypothetical protein
MMKILMSSIASITLAATLLPSILVFTGTIELDTHKAIMAVAMVLWFVTSPFFMKRKDSP